MSVGNNNGIGHFKMKVLNGTKLILDDQVNHFDLFKSVWNHSGLSEVPYSTYQEVHTYLFATYLVLSGLY